MSSIGAGYRRCYQKHPDKKRSRNQLPSQPGNYTLTQAPAADLLPENIGLLLPRQSCRHRTGLPVFISSVHRFMPATDFNSWAIQPLLHILHGNRDITPVSQLVAVRGHLLHINGRPGQRHSTRQPPRQQTQFSHAFILLACCLQACVYHQCTTFREFSGKHTCICRQFHKAVRGLVTDILPRKMHYLCCCLHPWPADKRVTLLYQTAMPVCSSAARAAHVYR